MGATRGVETTIAGALVTPEQENQIGLQLKNELDTKQKIVYMTDPAVVGYVRTVATKVTDLGKKDRPEVTWQIFVIDDAATVNAFATPGGYLYVYRGLLEAASNEAELAGVMAHEAGHVVARHAARSLVAQHGLQAVAALATGSNPGLLAQLTTGIATQGLLLKHSRADETEADEFGARYAAAAGYDPHAFVTFFGRLQKQEGSVPGVLTYLSDHPATSERIEHLNQYIASQGLTGTGTGQVAYDQMRKRLKTLPVVKPAKGSTGAPAGAPPAPPAGAPPPV
ncbi:MAG: M48 family metalloprotease [Myxococcales bacterium]